MSKEISKVSCLYTFKGKYTYAALYTGLPLIIAILMAVGGLGPAVMVVKITILGKTGVIYYGGHKLSTSKPSKGAADGPTEVQASTFLYESGTTFPESSISKLLFAHFVTMCAYLPYLCILLWLFFKKKYSSAAIVHQNRWKKIYAFVLAAIAGALCLADGVICCIKSSFQLEPTTVGYCIIVLGLFSVVLWVYALITQPELPKDTDTRELRDEEARKQSSS